MTLFANKYRIESNRKAGRDYRLPGYYFITICTKNMECIFGTIKSEIMGLNTFGCVVADEIQKTPLIRSYVRIDHWVVMPNHIHMIVQIEEVVWQTTSSIIPTTTSSIIPTTTSLINTIVFDTSVAIHTTTPICFRTKHSIGDIVLHIKRASTKRIRGLGFSDFSWQSNYHDKIIYNKHVLYACRNYIRQNPSNWHLK